MIKFFLTTLLILPLFAQASEPFTSIHDNDGISVMENLTLPKEKPALGWATDPFEKLPGYSGSEQEEEEFELAGTLGQDRNGVAIIGENVVSIGEKVGSRKLRKVGADFVLLEKGGSVIEVPLNKEAASANKGRSIASVPDDGRAPVLKIEEIKK